MTTILVITHPESDYGGAFLHDGLRQVLGAENVVDFPPKLSYHGRCHRYKMPQQQSMAQASGKVLTTDPVQVVLTGRTSQYAYAGYQFRNSEPQIVPASVATALLRTGRFRFLGAMEPVDEALTSTLCVSEHLGYTDPLSWVDRETVCAEPWEPFTEDAVRTRLRDGGFDGCIIESFRAVSLHTAYQLRADLLAAKIPILMLDSDDWDDVSRCLPHCRSFGCTTLLKRELYPPDPSSRQVDGIRVVGFPFSIPYADLRRIAAQSLDMPHYDVVMLCGNTHDLRVATARELRNGLPASVSCYISVAPDPDGVSTPGSRLHSWEEYVALMGNAKVSISVRGYGRDTVRLWESLACTATVACAQSLAVDHPYVDGVHFCAAETAQQVVEKVRWLLEHDERRQGIRAAGIQHTQDHHTTVSRARHALSLLGLGV